jgi:hypothetical protein
MSSATGCDRGPFKWTISLAARENHMARRAVVSMVMNAGHGPICRPALSTHVVSMRSTHEPPLRNGA